MKWGCVVVVLDWATNSFLVYLIYSRFYSRLSFIQFKRGHVNLVEWNRRHDEMALAQRVGKNFTKRIIFILSPNLLPNYSPSHNFNRKISNQHSLNVFWPPIWLPVITLIVAFIVGFIVVFIVGFTVGFTVGIPWFQEEIAENSNYFAFLIHFVSFFNNIFIKFIFFWYNLLFSV